MYAVYAQDLKGKFRPLDLKNGTTTTKLLYASLFNEREKALACMKQLQEWNSSVKFEVRKV